MTAYNPVLGLLNSFNQAMVDLEKRLAGAGYHLQRNQICMLLLVQAGITRATHAARFIGVTRQSVHQTIDSLIDAGLVQTEVDRRDRRVRILSLTDKGAHISAVLNVPG